MGISVRGLDVGDINRALQSLYSLIERVRLDYEVHTFKPRRLVIPGERPTPSENEVIIDKGAMKYWNGSQWVTIGGDIDGGTP